MSDDEKALIAEARRMLGDSEYQGNRRQRNHMICDLADALEARVHPTVTDAEVQSAAEVIVSETGEPGWSAVVIARRALEAARAVQPTTNPKEAP